jgi:hypothetical protein
LLQLGHGFMDMLISIREAFAMGFAVAAPGPSAEAAQPRAVSHEGQRDNPRSVRASHRGQTNPTDIPVGSCPACWICQ